MAILITGAAGFIGYNFCEKFAKKNPKTRIICIDNINNYYSTKIKRKRIKRILRHKNVLFFKIDLVDQKKLEKIFLKYSFLEVYNFAAQAGVR